MKDKIVNELDTNANADLLALSRRAALDVLRASRNRPVSGRLARMFVHDWCNRLCDTVSAMSSSIPMPEPEGPWNIVRGIIRLAFKCGKSELQGDWRDNSSGQIDGATEFAILDWSPRRMKENAALCAALTSAGWTFLPLRLRPSLQAAVVLRALVFPLVLRTSRERAYRWMSDQKLPSVQLLSLSGVGVRDVVPSNSAIALNFGFIEVAVNAMIRCSESRKHNLVLINRSGGRQVASIVYFADTRENAVDSLHIVHSSATGFALPESAVFGSAILARSARQAEELTVSAPEAANVVVTGRLLIETEDSGHLRDSAIFLLAPTQRRSEHFSDTERGNLFALWEHLNKLSHCQTSIRFKDSAAARSSFRDEAPVGFVESISQSTVSHDLKSHDIVLVVSWNGYTSTILHDAKAMACGIINTSLESSEDKSLLNVNPTHLQATSFVDFQAIMQMNLSDVRQCVFRADAIRDEFEPFCTPDELARTILRLTRQMG